MNKYESKEDYLERILMLSERNGSVRAIDLAIDMEFSKPSVSIALKKLKNSQLILVDEHTGNITLTEQGMKIAQATYEKHKIIASALMLIGVKEEVALSDACKIEHDISEETFNCLKKIVSRQTKK